MATTQKTTERMQCPIGDYSTPTCDTKEAAAAWLIEHMIENHPGGLPAPVVTAVKGVTGQFK